MKPFVLEPAAAEAAVRALHTVALAGGTLDPREERFVRQQAELLGVSFDPAASAPIEPAELAEAVRDPAERASLVQRMVLVAMMDAELAPEEIEATKRFAAALGVQQPAIHQMEMFVAGRMKLLAFDLGRRSFVAEKLRAVWREEGLQGMWKIARQSRPDPTLAAKYQSLSEYDDGTLGRGLYEHLRGAGFALPGEENGAPEVLLFHDIGHVLTGHGTDAEGELAMGGFEAGYMGEDGFSITIFTLYLFHLGANLLPTVEPTVGRFDLEAFRAEFHRGQGVVTDLRYWDAWKMMDRPVREVRAHLGVS